MSRFSSLLRRSVQSLAILTAAIAGPLLLGTAPVAAQALEQPAAPPIFTEVPGKQEFSGFLIARPLQAADAERLGLNEAQRLDLRQRALDDMTRLGITREFPEVDEFIVRVPAGDTENAVAARLLASGAFEYVHPDWTVYPVANCPNDPLLSQQWHHNANRLNSCAAWAIETGSPTVIVAVCDTGIRTTHQDLLLHRVQGYHVPTEKWESQGGPINDINGHGTLVTGAAAANGNNGVGVVGMGFTIGHRMMRVTDSSNGSASLSNLTLAARRAAEFGDKVACVSYSGVNNSSVFTTGTYVRNLGAMLVWAAGNSNVNLNGNREDNVIVVGATTQSDTKASFSNFGPLVDLVAPGVSIRTTSNASNTAYAYVNGTSFAAPLVAGLCALIWSHDPSLTPWEVEDIIRATCVDLGAAGVDNIFGYGRVDAGAALALVAGSGGGGGGGSTPQVLFADGFESGNLTAGNWVRQNTNAFATTAAAFSGNWGARLRNSTWMYRMVNTTGMTNIEVTYTRRTANLQANQWLYVDYWNGSSWQPIEQIKSNSWQTVTFSLPADAANNPNFALAFILNANNNNRRADIDNVEIRGTPN